MVRPPCSSIDHKTNIQDYEIYMNLYERDRPTNHLHILTTLPQIKAMEIVPWWTKVL